jgi:hypothetical protein
VTIEFKGNWNDPTAIRFRAGRIAGCPQARAAARIALLPNGTDPGLARRDMFVRGIGICRAAVLGRPL